MNFWNKILLEVTPKNSKIWTMPLYTFERNLQVSISPVFFFSLYDLTIFLQNLYEAEKFEIIMFWVRIKETLWQKFNLNVYVSIPAAYLICVIDLMWETILHHESAIVCRYFEPKYSEKEYCTNFGYSQSNLYQIWLNILNSDQSGAIKGQINQLVVFEIQIVQLNLIC